MNNRTIPTSREQGYGPAYDAVLSRVRYGQHPGMAVDSDYDDSLGLSTPYISTEPPLPDREWAGTLQIWRDGTVAKVTMDTHFTAADGSFKPYQLRRRRDDSSGLAIYDADSGSKTWNGGYRGIVRGFSKDSRRRLLRETGKLDRRYLPVFVTLTYADENWTDDPKQWKTDLDRFHTRLRRKYPGMSALWRLELVRRKSGEKTGEYAPHFHLIVWLGMDKNERADKATINGLRTWCDDAWSHGLNRVEAIRTSRGCTAYISKYVAKADSADLVESYPDGIGRVWGKWSADKMPVSDVVELILPYYEAMAVMRYFKRQAFGWMGGEVRDDIDFDSLSCFVNPQWLLDNLDAIIDAEWSRWSADLRYQRDESIH